MTWRLFSVMCAPYGRKRRPKPLRGEINNFVSWGTVDTRFRSWQRKSDFDNSWRLLPFASFHILSAAVSHTSLLCPVQFNKLCKKVLIALGSVLSLTACVPCNIFLKKVYQLNKLLIRCENSTRLVEMWLRCCKRDSQNSVWADSKGYNYLGLLRSCPCFEG